MQENQAKIFLKEMMKPDLHLFIMRGPIIIFGNDDYADWHHHIK